MANKLMLSFLRGLNELGAYSSGGGGTGTLVTDKVPYPGAKALYLRKINIQSFWYAHSVNLPASLSEFYFGLWFMFPGPPDTLRPFFRWKDSEGTVVGTLKLQPSGIMELWKGYNTAKLCSTARALVPNQYYWIDVYAKIGASGEYQIYIDGSLEDSYSGDTQVGLNSVLIMEFGSMNNSECYQTGLVVNDSTGTKNNGVPGITRLALLNPTSDAGPNAWTPSAGTDHYALVDEDEPDGADKLTSDTVAQQEVFGLEDLPAEAYLVEAVCLHFVGKKNADAAPDAVKLGVETGGDQYLSGPLACPAGTGYVVSTLDTNPAGGDWTPAGVNGAELVIESAEAT